MKALPAGEGAETAQDPATGTTFSDGELAEWSAIRRADEQHAYWDPPKKGFSAQVAVCALAGEALAMRRILRDFIARHDEETTDPLALRAVALLGFNLEPSQPLFPQWPSSTEQRRPPTTAPRLLAAAQSLIMEWNRAPSVEFSAAERELISATSEAQDPCAQRRESTPPTPPADDAECGSCGVPDGHGHDPDCTIKSTPTPPAAVSGAERPCKCRYLEVGSEFTTRIEKFSAECEVHGPAAALHPSPPQPAARDEERVATFPSEDRTFVRRMLSEVRAEATEVERTRIERECEDATAGEAYCCALTRGAILARIRQRPAGEDGG